MSLFPSANDFKSGPGVEKDAPRKTGVGRFFELVGRDMSGMFLANLLTCLGFLPVICLVYIGFLMNSLPVMVLSAAVGGILAGPVLAGMYDTVLRALRDEAGYWWTTYRKAFKQNFKASILPGVLYCVVVTVQIFLVYFCFNLLYHGTNVGVGMWVATVLNLVIFHMLFSYMWPQVVLLDQPFGQTLKNSVNCMIAFLPHALAASLVTVLFWGLVILCMPLGLLLMLVFGFWFQVEITSQISTATSTGCSTSRRTSASSTTPSMKPRWPRSAATTRNKRHTDAERGCVQWNSGTIWCCRARRRFPADSSIMWRWTTAASCWTAWPGGTCNTAATRRPSSPCRPSAT